MSLRGPVAFNTILNREEVRDTQTETNMTVLRTAP